MDLEKFIIERLDFELLCEDLKKATIDKDGKFIKFVKKVLKNNNKTIKEIVEDL